MIKTIKKLFFDKSFLVFLIIGVVNTLFGLAITFSCYNLLGFDYWTSSALDYILASILSYFLNKRFTFHYKENNWKSVIKFAANIIICYFIAFSLARPCAQWILELFDFYLSKTFIENTAMLVGTALFTVINYLGQRFFAFKK